MLRIGERLAVLHRTTHSVSGDAQSGRDAAVVDFASERQSARLVVAAATKTSVDTRLGGRHSDSRTSDVGLPSRGVALAVSIGSTGRVVSVDGIAQPDELRSLPIESPAASSIR